MSIAASLPSDLNDRFFVGPEGKVPKGRQVGSTDYATAFVELYDANDRPLLVSVDLDSGGGTAYRAGIALLVPASGGPAVITGDVTNGLDVDVTRSSLPTGGTPTAGTKSLTTTSAAALSASQACKSVLVQNDPDNTVDVLIGDSSSQTIQLRPGAAIILPVSNVNLVYGANVTSTTQSVGWIAIN